MSEADVQAVVQAYQADPSGTVATSLKIAIAGIGGQAAPEDANLAPDDIEILSVTAVGDGQLLQVQYQTHVYKPDAVIAAAEEQDLTDAFASSVTGRR